MSGCLKKYIMHKSEINKIIDEYYEIISNTYSKCSPQVELYDNIYERLSGIKGMSGTACAKAEYDWSENKIYLYTSRLNDEEDVIKALIHECVHSTQSKLLFDIYYEFGYTYDTHPCEVAAKKAEKQWKNIYVAEMDKWMTELGEKNGKTLY